MSSRWSGDLLRDILATDGHVGGQTKPALMRFLTDAT